MIPPQLKIFSKKWAKVLWCIPLALIVTILWLLTRLIRIRRAQPETIPPLSREFVEIENRWASAVAEAEVDLALLQGQSEEVQQAVTDLGTVADPLERRARLIALGQRIRSRRLESLSQRRSNRGAPKDRKE